MLVKGAPGHLVMLSYVCIYQLTWYVGWWVQAEESSALITPSHVSPAIMWCWVPVQVRAHINSCKYMYHQNIKAPRYWPLCGEFTGTGEFPSQRASYAENISIWWRHHDPIYSSLCLQMPQSKRCLAISRHIAYYRVWHGFFKVFEAIEN